MIERHWRGIAKKERTNEYIDHLINETFRKLKQIHGFVSASVLKRDLPDGVEFLVVTGTLLPAVLNFLPMFNP